MKHLQFQIHRMEQKNQSSAMDMLFRKEYHSHQPDPICTFPSHDQAVIVDVLADKKDLMNGFLAGVLPSNGS